MTGKEKSFEDLMGELDSLVTKLEHDDLKLDDAIKHNEEALKLINLCRNRLDSARQKIDKLVRNTEGDWQEKTLD
ncbi:MAG: exodeoxyribonuclease VII small subunit [Candidatus Marinimicrobia bacterium]|nr:exodeoxyribonuclease VII small subunit [Candidatus Neomarinimicrobiota bacterium]